MKDLSQITCAIVDYGSFISLAETMAKQTKRTLFYSPHEEEFLNVLDCVIGEGLERVERVDDLLSPNNIQDIDLFIFPDRGYAALQNHLRDDMKKAVWGSFGVCELEEYRTLFVKFIKSLGLPLIKSVTIRGLTALAEHLKNVENKWVKIDRYRANMETWHHIDYFHSQRPLEKLAKVFGPLKDEIMFVVQDAIEGGDDDPVVEIGYDGWCVDGEYPEASFQGYEKKNELYLGSLLKFSELPKEVQEVNRAMSDFLKKRRYRNFIATELRVRKKVPYFIDPTTRMPGQTGEQLLETCSNLPKVIWQGANGILTKPEFEFEFACEATLHYTAGSHDEWKTITMPEKVKRWVKLYHYLELDDGYHFTPHPTDEIGVILGVGKTIQGCLDNLKEHMDELKNEPVSIEFSGFADLLKEIKEAEEHGMYFADQKIPAPQSVLA